MANGWEGAVIMALKVGTTEVWAGELADSPGGLANVLGGLAGGGADLEFVIARRDPANPGRGQVFVTPIKGARGETAAGAAGLSRAEDVATLRVEGADKAGVRNKMMRAIADEGINVRGVSAAVIGGKFIAYIGFDSTEDAQRARAALGSVNAGSSGAKRAGPRRAASRTKSSAKKVAGATRKRMKGRR